MTDLSYLESFCTEQHLPFVPMTLLIGNNNSVLDVWHYLSSSEDQPFWAFAWPGGQALARWTLENAHLFRGQHVLDIGPGTGINSIAAAMAGAASVSAYDIEPMSADLTQYNVEMNGLADRVETYAKYFDPKNLSSYDVIVMGDCFYDALAARQFNALADVAHANDVPFYTGDTLREHFPRRRAEYLAQYAVPDIMRERGQNNINAYVFKLGSI